MVTAQDINQAVSGQWHLILQWFRCWCSTLFWSRIGHERITTGC